MTNLGEPLELSAPQLRRKDPATGESCSWYHAYRQYLRLMELAASGDRVRIIATRP